MWKETGKIGKKVTVKMERNEKYELYKKLETDRKPHTLILIKREVSIWHIIKYTNTQFHYNGMHTWNKVLINCHLISGNGLQYWSTIVH